MPWRCVRLRPVLVAGVALLAAGSLAACDTSSVTPYSSSNEGPATPTPNPTGQVLHLKISSSTLKDERALVVYLPPGYNDPANQSRRYPVLYLLSGAPGSADDWYWGMHAAQTADRLIAAGTVPPMILASPDGNGGRLRDSQFVDSSDGHQPVETFLVRDVLGYVDGE